MNRNKNIIKQKLNVLNKTFENKICNHSKLQLNFCKLSKYFILIHIMTFLIS